MDYSNASYKDDSVSVREIVHPDLCSIPTDNVLKTQIADVDVKLAKLRMQLSSLVITDK